MSATPVFPNAPIIEAVFDIRVEKLSTEAIKRLESLKDEMSERYPEVKPKFGVNIEIESKFGNQDKGVVTTQKSRRELRGFVFENSNEAKIWQARDNGFTFNKLKPYERWEIFKKEARELWELYYGIVRPVKITRIALRYINRIELPWPFTDFREYILTSPEIAPGLPQGVDHFYFQFAQTYPDTKAQVMVRETIERITPDQKVPLVFDIDTFFIVSYSEVTDEMWRKFEVLRKIKNDIFFKSVTDKAKELFK